MIPAPSAVAIMVLALAAMPRILASPDAALASANERWRAGALARTAPCLRPKQAGTQVQGAVRVCPGRYRIPDPKEEGVIILAASGTTLDLTGVTLESGDSLPERYVGAGVRSRNVDGVSVTGGIIRGYRHGIRLEGGRGHFVRDVDASGSRAQRLRSTPTRYDGADWLDIFDPDTAAAYGAGVLVRRATDVTITGVRASGAQNGIGLLDVRGSTVADNDVAGNSGWGIHLWRSAHNVIARNTASRNLRCASPSYRRGCDSAALLLREQSDSNTIVDNDLTHSGDGLFLSGHRPQLQPSVGNFIARNDGSHAWHNAFEATFSWGNTFVDNRADSSDYGFWLGYSSGTRVQGSTVIGSRTAGIAIEHGSDNHLAANVIIGGQVGIRLFAPQSNGPASRGYRIDDNVLAKLRRAVVLERTDQVRLRGNLFDAVEDGIEADSAARAAQLDGNVFLRATGFFIRAPSLDASGNFWGAADLTEIRERVVGEIRLEPWQKASEAGY